MEAVVFEKFRDLVYDTSGISLGPNKVALLTARIGKRMRLLGVSTHIEYYNRILSDESGIEIRELLNAISTNVTHFFREDRHFDFLANIVKERSAQPNKSLRIWCAASSTGEEPYTIGMTILQNSINTLKADIIASDISTRVLQVAKKGIYRDQDVRDIPKPILKRFFQQGVGRAAAYYRVKSELRDMVEFKQINLSTPPFPVNGPVDIIFCRNVMIYFNEELKRKLVESFHSLLSPNGFLIVGLAESLTGKAKGFVNVEPSVYRKMA